MLADLLGVNPKNDTQENIAYAAKLWSIDRGLSALFNGKSKKEELEEKLLQRQIDAMGSEPDTRDFNKAMLAGRQLPAATGFLKDLFAGKPKFNYLPPSMANVISINRNQIKSAILRSAM